MAIPNFLSFMFYYFYTKSCLRGIFVCNELQFPYSTIFGFIRPFDRFLFYFFERQDKQHLLCWLNNVIIL